MRRRGCFKKGPRGSAPLSLRREDRGDFVKTRKASRGSSGEVCGGGGARQVDGCELRGAAIFQGRGQAFRVPARPHGRPLPASRIRLGRRDSRRSRSRHCPLRPRSGRGLAVAGQQLRRMPRDGALTLSDVRGSTLAIVCQPCARRRRYVVARLIQEHGDAKLTELLVTLANCRKRGPPACMIAARRYTRGLWMGWTRPARASIGSANSTNRPA
jgi:hypothetical protein